MVDLDHNQQAAVAAGPVDLFIEAGAGSGKTRVLTQRFVSAVFGDPPYEPSDPRALPTVTFTDKAAGELAERIRQSLNAHGRGDAARSLGDAWISTIHGLCARILRKHAFAAGIDPQFSVLDQVEASTLEAEALEWALGDGLTRDGLAAGLVDAYGYDTLADALLSVGSSVRALGLGADDVTTLDAQSAIGRLRECGEGLSGLACSLDELRQTRSVAANAAVARAAACCTLEALACEDVDSRALISGLTGTGLRKVASIEGHDELVEAVRETLCDARAACAQVAAGEDEATFLGMLAAFLERYESLKRSRGALDFNDLEIYTARLLEQRPGVAAEYRDRFAMVMVDEFQDTDQLQSKIVSLLARENLCTVGDENQSIYRFRHADVTVFRERGSQAAFRQRLDTNYRTAPALLEVTNLLFSHPALLGRSFTTLNPAPGTHDAPALYAGEPRFQLRMIDWSAPQGRDPHQIEAECVAQRVSGLIAAGVEPGGIAVLMRALARGRGIEVERALSARGIPVHLSSGGAFFACQEVIDARSLLKAIDNVWDDVSMTTVLAGSLGAVSADGLVQLRELASAIAVSSGRRPREGRLWEAMNDPSGVLDGQDELAVRRVVDAISGARAARGTTPLGETLLDALLTLDADLVYFSAGRHGARAWSNILKLARIAGEYEATVGGGIGGLLGYLDLRELHAVSEPEATLDGQADAVRVMSIHAAKGLEFDVVILAGLDGGGGGTPAIAVERIDGRPLLGMELRTADGAQPTLASAMVRETAAAASEAEALRLLYVGCTRARESLTIISRTDPGRDATDSLGGRLRRALGIASGGTLAVGSSVALDGGALVTLEEPLMPATPASATESAPAAAAGSRTAPDGVAQLERGEPRSDGAEAEAAPRAQPSPGQVSYSGLATYERCPYRFFLGSVLHLPAPPAAQGGDALAFGSALHRVLERLRSADDDPGPLIEAAGRAARLARASIRRLADAVEAYRTSPVAAEVFAADRVMREAPLAVPVGTAVLAGAIDAIAWSGTEALVVDYKTGTAPLTSEAAVDRYRLQGACYALAALAGGATTVRVVFMELERGRETSYEYSAADHQVLRAMVETILERMAREGYPPRGAYERELCETCPGLGGLCPITRPSGDDAG